MTNYTIGSSIFCMLHPRVFDFLTFIPQGPQFCKKIYSRVVKNRNFFYTLGLGVRPNILTPSHFLLDVPPWEISMEIYLFNCVYIPNFRQAEHLCSLCLPVEDLPQFIAHSRFRSAGTIVYLLCYCGKQCFHGNKKNLNNSLI